MNSGGRIVKTLWGGGIAAGSGLFAAFDPQAVSVSFIGIVVGTSIGIYGISQTIRKREYELLHRRIDELQEKLNKAEDAALAERRKRQDLEDKLEDSQTKLKRVGTAECPWPQPNGDARCHGEDQPLGPQPGETWGVK
jgi:hypothetical protein